MPAKSDRLFQRRKAPTKKDLSRKKASRIPNKRVLIVSEGEVTEPNYFEGFKAFAKLVNVDVDICGRECDSAPISVVNFAERKANSEGHFSSGGYDEVYCVFDRDTHGSFDAALSKILTLKKSAKFLAGNIEAITSYPSFEIWLLFHFIYTRKAFVSNETHSSTEQITAELRRASREFQNFEKALSSEQCAILFRLTDTAKANAARAKNDAKATGELNPSTSINELLDTLMLANIPRKSV